MELDPHRKGINLVIAEEAVGQRRVAALKLDRQALDKVLTATRTVVAIAAAADPCSRETSVVSISRWRECHNSIVGPRNPVAVYSIAVIGSEDVRAALKVLRSESSLGLAQLRSCIEDGSVIPA